MTCNKDENPVGTAKRLVQLIIESLDNSNEAKSLALVNSRAALDFQLRFVLFELANSESPQQSEERLSKYAASFCRVLEDFFIKDIGIHLRTGSLHQLLQAALAQDSCDQANPSFIRLPDCEQKLENLERQISGLRKSNSSRTDVPLDLEVGHDRTITHHRTTIREDPDVNKVDESESENERNSVNTPEANALSRNGRGPDCPAAGEMPVTFKPPEMTRRQKLGKEFMDQAYTFYRKKIDSIKGKRAIKVAVLDTGVDKAQVHFKGVRAGKGTSIREAQSFIGGDAHDNCGHGTEVAALVVAVAPHVDLYIAKVSEREEETGVDQWVKAINWAIGLEVDIINISAKAPNNKKIRNPIEKAEMLGIIILAAASNDGANSPRVFPACMDKVLAIHATDGHGNPLGFNPTPLSSCLNFSTLGAGVPSPLQRPPRFLKAGTSFSTSIAAGMAANILTIVEAIPNKSDDDGIQWDLVRRRVGMKAIFEMVSQARGGYNYLSPDWLNWFATAEEKSWVKNALRNL